MPIRNLIAALALLSTWMALPALANTWTDCAGGTSGDLISVKNYECLKFSFDENAADSRIFRIVSTTAMVCFDPALDSEGADVGEITIRFCPSGVKPTSNPENACFATSSAPITGITGSAGTQDACQRFGPGVYYVDIGTPPAAGDDAEVTIRGEGNR